MSPVSTSCSTLRPTSVGCVLKITTSYKLILAIKGYRYHRGIYDGKIEQKNGSENIQYTSPKVYAKQMPTGVDNNSNQKHASPVTNYQCDKDVNLIKCNFKRCINPYHTCIDKSKYISYAEALTKGHMCTYNAGGIANVLHVANPGGSTTRIDWPGGTAPHRNQGGNTEQKGPHNDRIPEKKIKLAHV